MIDQSQHPGFPGPFRHVQSFAGIHGHRFFTEHCFAAIQRGQRHLTVRHDRRDDADEVDIVPRDQRAPIVCDMIDVEIARDFCGMVAMRAGYRENPRAGAGFKAGYLRRARKARADDAYAYDLVSTHSSDPPSIESQTNTYCPGRYPSSLIFFQGTNSGLKIFTAPTVCSQYRER